MIGDIKAVVMAPIVNTKENDEIESLKCFVTGSINKDVMLLIILNETAMIKKQAAKTRYLRNLSLFDIY